VREGTTLDVLEIDAASNRGINEVRDLRDRLAYPPGHLRRKVYILDEAHQITRDAWNALLKSLEEPPEFVIFMFASTEPSGFPPAILSRLQRYDVRRLTVGEIEGKLTRILEADGRSIEPAALSLIARLAAGGMRDAESILDQLLSTSTDTITEAAVRDLLGMADAAAVDAFVGALLTGDVAAGIGVLDALEDRGRDPRALLDQVVDTVRARLIDPATPDPASLAAVARRLVAIDPDRAGIGGLRLQLELALFGAPAAQVMPTSSTAPVASRVGPAPVAAKVQTYAETPSAAPAPAPRVPAEPGAEAPPPSRSDSEAEPERPPTHAKEPQPDRVAIPVSVGVGDDLDRLVHDWPTIVGSVRPATRAVLTECRPIAVDGNVVTLGFPEAKAFLKDHAERRRAEVEAAVGGHLGREISVRSVATNIEVAPLVAVDDLVAEAKRIFGEDLVDVAEVD
jgi:DNA polymerase-3 subunit gamma/tau